MEASGFDEANVCLGAPKGYEDNISSLMVFRGKDDQGLSVVVSCWKVTQKELDEINKTGRVWLRILGVTMPPAHLDGLTPFE